MPIYNLQVEGKSFKIEITKAGEKTFLVKIGEKTQKIRLDTEKKADKEFRIKIGEKEYKVTIDKLSRKEPFSVKINDFPFKVKFKIPERKVPAPGLKPTLPSAPRKASRAVSVEEGAVVAPMTGKIVAVKVKEGDQVKAGQVVCVLEAMKMENEIVAPKSGKVKEVLVSEGSAVNESEVLLTIE